MLIRIIISGLLSLVYGILWWVIQPIRKPYLRYIKLPNPTKAQKVGIILGYLPILFFNTLLDTLSWAIKRLTKLT